MRSGFIYRVFNFWALALLLLPFAGKAQGGLPHGLYIGTDFLKPLWAQGLVAEPVLKYNTGVVAVFSLTYGYASIRRDEIFHNIKYSNKGQYLKPGIEFMFAGDYVSVGLSYLFSDYRETGETVLEGPYFGDKTLGYSRRLQARGAELNVNTYVPVNRRISLHFNARISAVGHHIKNGTNRDVPAYYTPGAGYIFSPEPPGHETTGGLSAGIIFNLTNSKQTTPPAEQ